MIRSRIFYGAIKKRAESLPEMNLIFPEDKIKKHYVYENIRNTLQHPDIYITQVRMYMMYRYMKDNYPEAFASGANILDVGDTSGIFLEALGRKGVSFNINKECVDFIRSKGINAVCGNAESIDFPDRSFDYTFAFQLLEHVPNPMKVLNELCRVTCKKVFLSIPNTARTRIYNKDFWVDVKKNSWKEENVRDVDCHIFEFSTVDFKKILTYTDLEYEDNFTLDYFDDSSFFGRLQNAAFPSYFNFFVLRPKIK